MASRSARRVTSVGSASAAAARAALTSPAVRSAPGLVQLGDDDVRAEPGQLERGGAADAAARAGDDRDLSGQLPR